MATSPSSLSRVRTVARVLDSAIRIPGTNFRFGLDPILGLIPGIGDLGGAAASAYIVLVGMQLGVSPAVAARMVFNIAVDTLVGSIPLLGDLFDAGWKSNDMNVALIERHVADPGGTRRTSALLILVVLVALLLLAAGGVAVTLLAFRYVFAALRS